MQFSEIQIIFVSQVFLEDNLYMKNIFLIARLNNKKVLIEFKYKLICINKIFEALNFFFVVNRVIFPVFFFQ